MKRNILKAQKKQKDYYDRKHSVATCFNVGSVVLKKDFVRKKRWGRKLDYQWILFYHLLERVSSNYRRIALARYTSYPSITYNKLPPPNAGYIDAATI